MRGRVLAATSGVKCCVTAQRARYPIDPMLARMIFGINYSFPRDLERQAPVFDEVGCQHTYVMAPPIEIACELAYPYCSDDIRRRERKADDQDPHLGGRPARISTFAHRTRLNTSWWQPYDLFSQILTGSKPSRR